LLSSLAPKLFSWYKTVLAKIMEEQMTYITYNRKTKVAIIRAVETARKAGKTWNEAHAAAIKAGHKGNLRNLLKMLYKSGIKTSRRRRKAAAAAIPMAPVIKRGPGRPPKAAGMDGLEALVNKLVRERAAVALDQAVAALVSARNS
jgi:hypothetical protein